MLFVNTGGNWPNTCALYLADFISVKQCTYDSSKIQNSPQLNSTVLERISNNACASDTATQVTNFLYTMMYKILDEWFFFKLKLLIFCQTKECENLGGKCLFRVDAYYIEAVVCSIFGVFWFFYFKHKLLNLQTLPSHVWKLKRSLIK